MLYFLMQMQIMIWILYVVSGGNEFSETTNSLKDRLYINDDGFLKNKKISLKLFKIIQSS